MLKFVLKICIALSVFLIGMSFLMTGGVSVAGIAQTPPPAVLIFVGAFALTELWFIRKRKRDKR